MADPTRPERPGDRARTGAPRGRPDPLVGTVVAGRFRIEARIAAGGMGTVYRAEQLGLDRKVALKLLHAAELEGTEDSQADDDLAVLEKRFSREAAILAKLSHPNVVTVFDYGRIDEPGPSGDPYDRQRPRFYMVMELLAGDTLQERLSRRKVFSVDEFLPIARQIARGLREAHALGVVHRDLKPANVMIVRDRDGEEIVKLLDFGIGKILDRDVLSSEASDPGAELTQEGRFVGSPLYMSPEQIAHGRVDARTDIYTLGVVMYRCLAGIHPFHKDRTALVMLAHLHEEAVPLRDRVPGLPAWLGELVDRCMQKEPGRRPATMDEVYRTLADHGAPAPHSSGLTPIGRRADGLPALSPVESITALPAVEEAPTLSSGSVSAGALLTPHTTTRPSTMAAGESTTLDAPRARKLWPFVVLGAVVVGVVLALILVARQSADRAAKQPEESSVATNKAAPPSAAPSPAPSPLDLSPSESVSAAPSPPPTVTPKVVKPPIKPPSAASPPPPVAAPDINLKR